MIKTIIQKELDRQNLEVELIASENYASKEVRACQGSVMTNKYAEGYPGKRYYGGCEHVDEVENIAIETAKKVFNVGFANVQPHSGSQANMAAYRVLMKGRENTRILAMNLQDGGHLTHGHKMSFSGQDYNFVSYGVDDAGLIDYMAVQRLVNEYHPTLIVAGASAYSRAIDFKRFRQIADTVGAYLMVDMAHIAGLVAAGLHQNPCEYADIVTTTTHKTLRGPRGGMILTNNADLAKQINSAVFPGIQGGPLMHVIAAKAQCLLEADTEEFKTYQANVILNTAAMSNFFVKSGYKVIADGTDNHLFLLDTKTSFGITGKKAEEMLSEWGIIVNKNTIPNDTEKPFITSGIRIGCAAITTRGASKDEVIFVAELISMILKGELENKLSLGVIYHDVLYSVVKEWKRVEDI